MSVDPKHQFRLTEAMVDAAAEWFFNCGPGALCGVLGRTPDEIRPHLLDFEKRGYTNPTLMFDILKALKIPHELIYRGDDPDPARWRWPHFGLVRIQWDGPWCRPGVPMAARYRQTHWVARRVRDGRIEIFDVNAVVRDLDGWLDCEVWNQKLVPWLLKEVVPRATGGWWPTHSIHIQGSWE